MELCDSDVTDHGLVFGQLTYDICDVSGSLVWFKMHSIAKFNSYLLKKENLEQKSGKRENKCYNCFGVHCCEVWTSIYRPKLEIGVKILALGCKLLK